jgi:V8-like Glu-specific endopeptidase
MFRVPLLVKHRTGANARRAVQDIELSPAEGSKQCGITKGHCLLPTRRGVVTAAASNGFEQDSARRKQWHTPKYTLRLSLIHYRGFGGGTSTR